VPVNQPTHGHGQGWADLNFLIPELVEAVQYKKGPYYAEVGDFSSAGAVDLHYADSLKKDLLSATVGQYGYYRLLGAKSGDFMGGKLLYALELGVDDGPWDVPQDLRKLNSVVRYSRGDRARGMNVSAMAYDNRWTATDQIPKRAVDQRRHRPPPGPLRRGLEQRRRPFGPPPGVRQERLSQPLFQFHLLPGGSGQRRPVPAGGRPPHLRRQGLPKLAHPLDSETEVGVQVRYDDIDVSLHKTKQRQRLSTVRADQVGLGAYGVYAKNDARWNGWLRTVAGIRADLRRANVEARPW